MRLQYTYSSSSSIIRYECSLYVRVLQSRASRSRCSIPGTWYGTCKHPTNYKSEARGSVSRVKTPCEQGLPHCTYVLQAEQRLPHATEEKVKRSFPMERGPTAKHHRAWNPQCTQTGLGQRSFRSSALNRKSCHVSVSVKSILPDAAHDSRNQGRVVSLSALSLLSACVRLRQLREVHHSLQQALNPCSRTQSAATDGSPACCTSSLMLRVRVMLRVLPSQSSVRSLLVLLLCEQRCLSCLARPVWGTTSIAPCKGVLPRTNARCVVGQ